MWFANIFAIFRAIFHCRDIVWWRPSWLNWHMRDSYQYYQLQLLVDCAKLSLSEISVAISSRNRCITSAVSRFWCTAHTVHVAHSGKLHYLFKSELLCFCKLCSTQVKVYTVQFVHHLYNGYLFYFKQISYRELSVYGSSQICSLYWQ